MSFYRKINYYELKQCDESDTFRMTDDENYVRDQ